MYTIIELHLDGSIIGIVSDYEKTGEEHLTFITKKEAIKYAKEKLAFDYSVVEV